ncbi:flagellar basal body rod protein FlgB [Borreliella spielmanii]|uniref:Flagellar basal body rod protein FlgB n=1 Tax=Borreliella spielmanii A14S TaxID=498742 RepID=C0APU9_9SPIR|nr:flagellar basal body rod protein FlgB [Borreliella spielmanii]EEF84801.1 flagellar basal-body rod protein FlgB [Borreliella spielmanii A14S]WKC83381.1 flagellar basal body rod protein FlgB [Borreliella spielmanii]
MNDFERSVDFSHRYLDVLSLRQSVVSDNIANVDTPNFKRSKISFEAELEKALLNKDKNNLNLIKSSDKHLSRLKSPEYSDVKPHRVLDHFSTMNNNGNNVDIDSEIKVLVQNQMMYHLMTNVQAHYFKSINIVLK